MAKVTITFEDSKKGHVTMGVDFDPPVGDDDGTPAQHFGATIMVIASRHAQGESLMDIAEDLDDEESAYVVGDTDDEDPS